MAILYTLPVDFRNSFVGFGFRFFQCGSQGHHIQDTAAINHVFSIFLYSACMEYDTACLFCLIQSGDDFAGGMGTGIAFGGHDYVYGTSFFPFHVFFFQISMDAFQHNLCQVTVKEGKHRFRFRIAEAAVEFHHFRAFVGNHKACIKTAFEGVAFFFHGCHDGPKDFDFHFIHHFIGHHRGWCIGTHAAGIGTFVIIENSLMVLGGNHRYHMGPVAEAEDRRFFPFHKFFDDYRPSGTAEAVSFQHVFYGINGFFFALGNDDALACCQTVRLDDNRILPVVFQVFHGLVFIGKYLIGCCRNIVFLHQVLGKSLGPFDTGSCFRGAKEGQPLCFEFVCQTFSENRFRPCNGEIHLHQSGKVQNIFMALQRNQVCYITHAIITGDGVDFGDRRTLCQPPEQGMFPAAASND